MAADTAYGKDEAMFAKKVPTASAFDQIADAVEAIQVVTALPSDAASHPKTLYIIKEE